MSSGTWLLLQAGATLPLVGLIWFVQLVHYPLMGKVGAGHFVAYQAAHVRQTAWVVVPLMLTEALSSLALLGFPPAQVPRAEVVLGLVLLAGVWASTFLLQVPLHERLGREFAASDHARLVKTNAIRTALWTGRGGLVLVWLARGLS